MGLSCVSNTYLYENIALLHTSSFMVGSFSRGPDPDRIHGHASTNDFEPPSFDAGGFRGYLAFYFPRGVHSRKAGGCGSCQRRAFCDRGLFPGQHRRRRYQTDGGRRIHPRLAVTPYCLCAGYAGGRRILPVSAFGKKGGAYICDCPWAFPVRQHGPLLGLADGGQHPGHGRVCIFAAMVLNI